MAIRPLRVIPAGESILTGHHRSDRSFATWRIHGTNDWQLMYTAAGGGHYAWEGGGMQAIAGDLVLLRPGTRHDYRTDHPSGRWENLWAHVLPGDGWLDLLDWPEAGPGVLRIRCGDDQALRQHVQDGLLAMHRLASGAGPHRERLALNALEAVLLWIATASAGVAAGHDPRIRAAQENLCQDLISPLGPADLARAAGLSTSRFAHLFRAQVGMSVLRYREEQRLRRACRLLTATARAIGDIAAEVGFPDPLYFSVRFKRFMGRSPRAWRRAGPPTG